MMADNTKKLDVQVTESGEVVPYVDGSSTSGCAGCCSTTQGCAPDIIWKYCSE